MPQGWTTEEGARPEYGELYGLRELPGAEYADRTRRNVAEAGAVLWFGDPTSTGGQLTLGESKRRRLPVYLAESVSGRSPEGVADWIRGLAKEAPLALLVAGNRESGQPGLAAAV